MQPFNLFDEIEAQSKGEVFQVNTPEAADWCLSKIAAHKKQYEKAKKQYDHYLAKMNAWLENIKTETENNVSYFEHCLIDYTMNNLPGKKRSIDLPHGRVGFRKTPDKIEIRDEEKAIAWLDENYPAGIITKKTISKKAIKGVDVPGTQIIQGSDRIYTEPDLELLEE